MAFPVVESQTGNSSGAETTTHTIAMPSGIQANELLIVYFHVHEDPTISGWPAGWTQLFIADENVNRTSECRYKFASGSETNFNLSTTESKASAFVSLRISGYKAAQAPAFEYVNLETNDLFPDPPNLTPGWGADDTLWIVLMGYEPGSRSVSGYPDSYTNVQYYRWSDALGVGASSCTRQLNASSENPGTFTMSSNVVWGTATLGIQPGLSPVPTGLCRITGS